jgi:CheY-like chemotaxis protein
VVVLDIILPGIDGWDMLLRMKDREETRNIPVVIVSVTDERRRGFALGASQVLAKPVDPDDLLAAVASVDIGNGRKGARVLVVDDDPKAVTLVSKHLEVAGFVPVGAYGGAEALALARDGSTALIILDLMMPAVSGFDVVRALRADPATADIPIIVLTAKLLNNEDRTTLHGQVQQVLEKAEFLPASLLAEVRRALARHRHAEENV